jgi:hypothetical protein
MNSPDGNRKIVLNDILPGAAILKIFTFTFNVLIYALKGKLILAVEQMNCFMTLQYEFM